jgi:5-methylcytosine-specific restriction endonuclease McrBC GTP-binding regulatory subunit McrB
MSSLPSYDLELKAANERQRLHDSVTELKVRLNESLDVRKNIRQHFPVVGATSAVLALVAGYYFTGMFTRH